MALAATHPFSLSLCFLSHSIKHVTPTQHFDSAATNYLQYQALVFLLASYHNHISVIQSCHNNIRVGSQSSYYRLLTAYAVLKVLN